MPGPNERSLSEQLLDPRTLSVGSGGVDPLTSILDLAKQAFGAMKTVITPKENRTTDDNRSVLENAWQWAGDRMNPPEQPNVHVRQMEAHTRPKDWQFELDAIDQISPNYLDDERRQRHIKWNTEGRQRAEMREMEANREWAAQANADPHYLKRKQLMPNRRTNG